MMKWFIKISKIYIFQKQYLLSFYKKEKINITKLCIATEYILLVSQRAENSVDIENPLDRMIWNQFLFWQLLKYHLKVKQEKNDSF